MIFITFDCVAQIPFRHICFENLEQKTLLEMFSERWPPCLCLKGDPSVDGISPCIQFCVVAQGAAGVLHTPVPHAPVVAHLNRRARGRQLTAYKSALDNHGNPRVG